MAYKSDQIVKEELLSIGNMGNLKIRVFPSDTQDDQMHWIDGGLCFGRRELLYGSCDGAWYTEESWTDPLTRENSNLRPVIAVEGTLALERGSSGNAQYQRFFHALGAIRSGIIGVYYLRKGESTIRPDLFKAALNASAKHGKPYLVIDELAELQGLVETIANHGEDSPQASEIIQEIYQKMLAYWENAFEHTYKGDIKNYHSQRSIIQTTTGEYIKYAGRNYRNFTESSQRAGHIALGEFYIAKYLLDCPFYYFLPRLTPDEIGELEQRNAKEWKLMQADDLGEIVTIENFTGIGRKWKRDLRSDKDAPLKGQVKSQYNQLMRAFKGTVQQGKINLARNSIIKEATTNEEDNEEFKYDEDWEGTNHYQISDSQLDLFPVKEKNKYNQETPVNPVHPKNKLNGLTGKEWILFTKSWFVFNALPSDLKEERETTPKTDDHPATFSPTMVSEFIRFFTKEGQTILDPFVGIGSTLVACDRTNRKGIGIELNPKYAEIAKLRTKQQVIIGDARQIGQMTLPPIDYCISSPPYWNVLQRSTKDFKQKRLENELDVQYSKSMSDIGNITNYEEFLQVLVDIYRQIYDALCYKSYTTIIVKNVKKQGKLYPLAWDLARLLSDFYVLKDERIWVQDQVRLAPYGYPYAWVSNILHHYCLILRKE